jgi:CDP-diacylglycerol--glycerol-3-phosphate 3-phosphatidyltransferase
MVRGPKLPPLGQDPASLPPSDSGLWNIPNLLTMLRLVLVPVFAWLLLRDGGQDDTSRVWAAVVFVVASFTDFFDGYLARKWNIVTTFGKVADPIADKALTGCELIGLSYLGDLPWWVTIIILGREVMVTVLRFWVIKHGVIAASRGGKAKTVAQMIAIVLFLLPNVDGVLQWIFMGIAVALTLATGVDYIRKALQVRAYGQLRDEAGLPRTPR